MKCLPHIGKDTDNPYWVTKEQFYNYFDQDDFNDERDVRNVVNSYLNEWFYFDDDNTELFILPTVQIVSGKTQFVNGRHRTAVLLTYLQEIPIAFDQSFNQKGIRLSNYINRPINMSTVLELPDLPKFEKLP